MHIRWRGLELPSQVQKETLTPTYGKFVAEPFERGFGVTVGNSLRRILLSSLEGSAITQVRIQGAQHEFTTIEGIIEDATDIVLNVKSLVVKNHSDTTKVIRVEKNSVGDITGADVITDSSVEVINKDHKIATSSGDRDFEMEMVVENGRGYVPASEHTPSEQEIGIIPIDAVYSPVIRVRYEIEETRVGQKTNYDKLTMEIWTNGSIQPEIAMVEAAKILRKHLNPFVQFSDLGPEIHSAVQVNTDGVDPAVEKKLNMSISELHLSVRAGNCLEAENILTVRDLIRQDEDSLMEVRNFGDTTLHEVNEKLGELGLRLGARVSSHSSIPSL
jgi:DNA-directed RNA polymerase subunit alpha